MGFKPLPTAIAVALGLIIGFIIPVPEGVTPNAWHLLALFVGTIAAIIGKALPIGALSIIAIALVAVTGVTNEKAAGAMNDALSSFSNSLIWLIGVSIMISRGIIKTGLGARIGYLFIAVWGKKTIGIAYSLALSELMPTRIRSNGMSIALLVNQFVSTSIAAVFLPTVGQHGYAAMFRYLALTNYHANPITSAMFITATAPNPLVVKLIADATGAQISLSWGTWALAMLLPGLVALALMPYLIYLLHPPEIKSTPNAMQFARDKLKELGPISRGEFTMFGVFAVLLVLWAGIPAFFFGPGAAVDPTTTAFIGLSLCLITGVLTWEDVIKEKSAWDTIIWFGALVMMATFLNKLGLIAWFAQSIEAGIGSLGLGWMGASALLLLTYLYAHYMFASTTAHITAMFAAFYGAGLALGAPALPFALMMAAASNIMMTLTHYATGTSPVIFGSGYTTLGEWWKTGFFMSVVLIAIWLVVGSLWWKVLGYW